MNFIYGRNAVIEAIKNNRKIEKILVKSKETDSKINYIISIAKEKKILVKETDKRKLDEITENKNHQGVICFLSDYEYYDFNDLLNDIKKNNELGIKNFIVVLDKIEDPHNFGAIVRSAHLAGVDAIIISQRRACSVTEVVEKTSSGATSYMKISKVTNLSDALEKLKENNMWIYALDMDGKEYYNEDLTGNVVIVIGNEGKGVSSLIKKNSDFTISIPMGGKIDSLNASVAGSIVMFDVVRQRKIKNGQNN